jgi:hypothetical protein
MGPHGERQSADDIIAAKLAASQPPDEATLEQVYSLMAPGTCPEPGRGLEAVIVSSADIQAEPGMPLRASLWVQRMQDQQAEESADLLVQADKAVSMAAGLREYLHAADWASAYGAADWLVDLAKLIRAQVVASHPEALPENWEQP